MKEQREGVEITKIEKLGEGAWGAETLPFRKKVLKPMFGAWSLEKRLLGS